MDSFEVKDILQTFRVVVDTREQVTPKAKERYAAFGVPVERCTLDYGDYAGNITLTNNKPLYSIEERIKPLCVVERKMSLDELASCFTRDRARFEREFERARSAGAKVFLLCENATWEALLNHRYRSRFHPQAFKASITAWSIRYDITPIFCKAETSGVLIKEILYRDIKERLERGEYG